MHDPLSRMDRFSLVHLDRRKERAEAEETEGTTEIPCSGREDLPINVDPTAPDHLSGPGRWAGLIVHAV